MTKKSRARRIEVLDRDQKEDFIKVLRGKEPLDIADRALLADYIAADLKRRPGNPGLRLYSREYYVKKAAAGVREFTEQLPASGKKLTQEQALDFLSKWWPSLGYKLDPESLEDMESVRNKLGRRKIRT